MSELVKLDEIEEYERELNRARAENRAPRLRDPHEVYTETIGNSDTFLEELPEKDQKKADKELHAAQKAAKAHDKKLKKVIRENIQAPGTPSVLPREAPDSKKYNAPKTKEEKEIADKQVEALYDQGRSLDDSYGDVNIPETDDDGHVLGSSVNKRFTRKMSTFSEEELVRENERNSVPVPERYKVENPPNVQQFGENTVPETLGYAEAYKDGEPVINNDDVPHTAITTPYPEHVIGDETGATREPTRDNETDYVYE